MYYKLNKMHTIDHLDLNFDVKQKTYNTYILALTNQTSFPQSRPVNHHSMNFSQWEEPLPSSQKGEGVKWVTFQISLSPHFANLWTLALISQDHSIYSPLWRFTCLNATTIFQDLSSLITPLACSLQHYYFTTTARSDFDLLEESVCRINKQ